MYLKMDSLVSEIDGRVEDVFHISVDIPFFHRFKFNPMFIKALKHYKKNTHGCLRPIPLNILAKISGKGNKFNLLAELNKNYTYGKDYEIDDIGTVDGNDILLFRSKELCTKFLNFLNGAK